MSWEVLTLAVAPTPWAVTRVWLSPASKSPWHFSRARS